VAIFPAMVTQLVAYLAADEMMHAGQSCT